MGVDPGQCLLSRVVAKTLIGDLVTTSSAFLYSGLFR